MIKIGVILFAIGLFLLSPLDEILILIPLSAILGLWIFPVAIVIALICLIVGAVLIGKHLTTVLKNPIVTAMFVFAIIIIIYYVFINGWLQF